MTVKELMEKLKELPEDIKIWFQWCDDWWLYPVYEWDVKIGVLDLVHRWADEYIELDDYMERIKYSEWPKSVLETEENKIKSERFLIFTI